jgi:PST family polysaccharide transporter
MAVGLLVGVWIARYLGPSEFGLLNYAIAFVSLITPIALLGLDQVVLRDLVNQPDRARETLGTAFGLKALAGCLTWVLALVVIALTREDTQMRAIVALAAAPLFFQAFDTVALWFQSQVRSKYAVIARNVSFMAVAVLRILLILAGAPLLWFAAAVAAEALFTALGLIVAYLRCGERFLAWHGTRARAIELLRSSWPLLFSTLAIAVYMKVAQIMLGQMLDSSEVGIYAAALRISEVWYFIPGAIVASVAPTLINAKRTDLALYQRRMEQLLRAMALLGYAVAVTVTFIASPLTWALYGPEYAAAGPVLSLHVWAGVLVCLGGAQHAWLINEGYTIFAMISTAVGAIVNVAFNSLLIPVQGAFGAAIATLISYGVVVLVTCFFFRPTVSLGRMTVKALLLRN